MAYPDFDDPMYEKLRDISSELLLPNLQLIPPNTMRATSRRTRRFIESYLTGLNYEFGKDLLWREYPTDRARQLLPSDFWDVRGVLAGANAGESAETVSGARKDIVPLDTCVAASLLGTHRNPLRPPGEPTSSQSAATCSRNIQIRSSTRRRPTSREERRLGTPRPSDDPVIAPVASDVDVHRDQASRSSRRRSSRTFVSSAST